MARSYTRIADGYCSKLLILRPVRVLANNRGQCEAYILSKLQNFLSSHGIAPTLAEMVSKEKGRASAC